MSIPYIKTIKPYIISKTGLVIFTDGTQEVMPNEEECLAYGYRYDSSTGTCRAFNYNTNLNLNFLNQNNTIEGSGNITRNGANNTYVMGENNVLNGNCRNNIVVGMKNQIAHGVNNTFVYGTLAESTSDNSIVLGGNNPEDLLAERQSIRVIYGTQTTEGAMVDSYLNNTTDSYFVIPDNSIAYFHADVIAVRVGGDSEEGDIGDYASWVERGVVINKRGTLSIQRERDSIKSSGVVTDWRPTAGVRGTNFILQVRGETNETIEWNSNITFTQIRTNEPL